MGTRGLMGFVIDGTEKLAYNHWDSYPSGLGLDMLGFLRDLDKHELQNVVALARSLRVVPAEDEQESPSPEDIEQLSQFADTSVGGQGVDNKTIVTWYQLLRRCQGDPVATLNAGVLVDGSEFASNSLFCEWGYVIDLDKATFEVYEGFQREPHAEGRFADREPYKGGVGDYYPIRLVASYSLEHLPTEDEFIADLKEEEDEDE